MTIKVKMQLQCAVMKVAIIGLGAIGALLVAMTAPQLVRSQGAPAILDSTYTQRMPSGIPIALWQKLIPSDNPMTAAKVALGEILYFDKRLSADSTLSCASCHDPGLSFANHDSMAVGIKNQLGTRNVPTLLNAMFAPRLFLDGRSSSLEEQVKVPLFSATEMGVTHPETLISRLAASPDYRKQFKRVFGDEGITVNTVAKAIAAFERTLLSGNSPFDRFMAGDQRAMTEAQKRGWTLFRSKGRCIACHTYQSSSPFFTDFRFHNTGIASTHPNFASIMGRVRQIEAAGGDLEQGLDEMSEMSGFTELGRYVVTRKTRDIGAFKTPTLRDVERTSPYMHDGSIKTLNDVVRFYSENGHTYVDPGGPAQPLNLTEAEMSFIVAFLRALTSDDLPKHSQTAGERSRIPLAGATK